MSSDLVCRLTITTESTDIDEDESPPWEIVYSDIPLAFLPPQGFKFYDKVLGKELEVIGEYYSSLDQPNLVTVIVEPFGGITDDEVAVLEANNWTIKKPRD